MDGNNLAKRFEQHRVFTIGELGFGSGLNFLSAWELWRAAKKPDGAHLHFFSVEAAPWQTSDLKRAHALWPSFTDIAKQLRTKLGPIFQGPHRIHISDDVSLTLFYGDVQDALSTMDLRADAWFLDGFAPSKNPAMWSSNIFAMMAVRSNPMASFTTFTVAGTVRRAASEAGFDVEKRTGFGKKREMLFGTLPKIPTQTSNTPWFSPPSPTASAPKRVAIIGAGIAGASLSVSLRRYGITATVFETSAPGAGASGNIAGLIMPRVDNDFSPIARFHIDAYLYALRTLNKTTDITFDNCGALKTVTGPVDKKRHRKILELNPLPDGFMGPQDNGLYFPQAGIVEPETYLAELLSDTPVIREQVQKFTRVDDRWQVTTKTGEHQFDAVLVANATAAHRFCQLRGLPIAASHGQIDYFPHGAGPQKAPDHALAGDGYAAPFRNGLIAGATYDNASLDSDAAISHEATALNIAHANELMGPMTSPLTPDQSEPRASTRCMVPDQTPICGPLPDWGFYGSAYDGIRFGRIGPYQPAQYTPGLHALIGLGSRGLTTGPLAAETLVSAMLGGVAPVTRDVSEALHPGRFFIRSLKRARPA